MIDFHRLTDADLQKYLEYVPCCEQRGCEYSFTNLRIWGRQQAAFEDGFLILFSQFDRSSVYPFPLGQGDIKSTLDKLIGDARKRGIPFRLSSMNKAHCQIVEALYPGRFRFHTDRDNYDYVYRTEDLAFLKGKRYQSKRNFVNRFHLNYPDCQFLPLDASTEEAAKAVAQIWMAEKLADDPLADFHLERTALERAFAHREGLRLEGMVLVNDGQPVAMTMGSRLCGNTFDIHFEKAVAGFDGAYAAINQAFARYLLEKYPEVEYLNREDDLGIEGLRKAKLSYHPDHLVEKYWARLWEDADEH